MNYPNIPFIAMATKAMHKCGDISSDTPDFAVITEMPEGELRGRWLTGFGLFNVKFDADTTRPLTKKDKAKYDKIDLVLNGQRIGKPKAEVWI